MSSLVYRKNILPETLLLIEKEYDITFLRYEQLYLGADRDTFVYKAESAEKKFYFIKIRTGPFNESSVAVPYALSKETGKHIITPLKTVNGKLYLQNHGFTVILYPFIAGKSGMEADLTDEQWIEFGRVMRRIHDYHNNSHPEFKIPFEQFNDRWTMRLREIIAGLESIEQQNELTGKFISMYIASKDIFMKLILHAEQYAEEIRNREISYCLCHADIHAANLLISEDDFYIVDWDTVIMAPKERDLMFIGAGVVNKWNTREEAGLFYRGYGDYLNIDRNILDYYRYIRIIEDIVVYYDQFFEKETDKENQESIIQIVDSIFLPGGVVDMAFNSII